MTFPKTNLNLGSLGLSVVMIISLNFDNPKMKKKLQRAMSNVNFMQRFKKIIFQKKTKKLKLTQIKN